MKLRPFVASLLLLTAACSDDDAESASPADAGHLADGGPLAHADGGPVTNLDGGSLLDAGLGHGGDGGADAGPAAWSYEGITGPSAWARLDPASYYMCADPIHESPIDLRTAIAATDLPDAVAAYGSSKLSVSNTGHTVQFNYDANSKVNLGGVDYALVQFHFHRHSEHTVDGKATAMELHLVHQDASGNKLVLAVFIEEGAANPVLGPLWSVIPTAAGVTFADPAITYSMMSVLPTGDAWRYVGSLTEPPCTEGVQWILYKTPITLSAAQIASFSALYPNNFRSSQQLGTRVVTFGR